MAKRSITALDAIVRDNVQRLLKKHYDGKPGRMASKNENVNLRGIQDFIKGGTVYLSSLQPWADAFGLKPYHLLIKDLNIDDPPELVSSRKLRKLEKIRKELVEEDV